MNYIDVYRFREGLTSLREIEGLKHIDNLFNRKNNFLSIVCRRMRDFIESEAYNQIFFQIYNSMKVE